VASAAEASPGITKKGGDSPPTSSPSPAPAPAPAPAPSSSARSSALSKLKEGERLIKAEQVGDGLIKMIEAYQELSQIDGINAKGVKELRSWLVKALEAAGMPDEAAQLKGQGQYVDHPLSVMPSTWFAGASSSGSATMTAQQATDSVGKGLDMLKAGNIDGLALLLDALAVLERESGAESEEAILVRSFVVNLLETGGFNDEAVELRAKGTVKPPTEEEKEVYALTWLKIIEASGTEDIKSGSLDSGGLKSGYDDSSPSSSDSSSTGYTGYTGGDDDDDDGDNDDEDDARNSTSASVAGETKPDPTASSGRPGSWSTGTSST
jgi:hypothetical protein